MGARDLAIGLGALAGLRDGRGARPWLLAGTLADAADLVATLRARDALAPTAVVGIAALAAGATAGGLWLAPELGQRGPQRTPPARGPPAPGAPGSRADGA